ncbi:CPBP family intramembrane glutamic endopeptidase [Pseudomonas syringae]|uniref:CPBP family intramembrane metalloprotease n=3 Tax=Pseudomonas syringae TaxID=317 RepID=A0A9Q4FI15_PSESX|nr:CPBP family intramembrane glutamic endopeptidase [Pseudomonas syringae]MCF5469938.1 CPBP family intramembrane metalloprotease [Pseudomonas syringae]MCF5473565.1 CPBP family intramembrane metalloprotease [Pseudomonas syringae]MCF5483604.1 CPBP family intramembrane metalloprotease [Pseudomonas syringae]MCF5490361.1 CPBP family intramembrane metalloprotease [Pseudomonas syringae]MCF5495307.1 CPBP family intramembrane metalloprotease [Pseudomonas syringae]
MADQATNDTETHRPKMWHLFWGNHGLALMPWLLIGPAVYVIYRQLVKLLMKHTPYTTLIAYDIPILYGPPAALLVMTLFLQKRFNPHLSLLGTIKSRHLVIGLTSVAIAYAVSIGISISLGLGRELTMQGLGLGKSEPQFLLMILSLLVLPPIVEEIIFRHFILGILPFKNNIYIAISAVIMSAVFFMYAHFKSYSFWPTHALMLSLGLIFAVARIQSGGLSLPVILHSSAVAIALSANYAWRSLGG